MMLKRSQKFKPLVQSMKQVTIKLRFIESELHLKNRLDCLQRTKRQQPFV